VQQITAFAFSNTTAELPYFNKRKMHISVASTQAAKGGSCYLSVLGLDVEYLVNRERNINVEWGR